MSFDTVFQFRLSVWDVVSRRPALKLQKRAMKELRAMFDTTSYFDSEQITAILMVCIARLFYYWRSTYSAWST